MGETNVCSSSDRRASVQGQKDRAGRGGWVSQIGSRAVDRSIRGQESDGRCDESSLVNIPTLILPISCVVDDRQAKELLTS